MVNIKRFVDRVSLQEGKNSRDLVLTIAEARGLRDELLKLLLDVQTQPRASQPQLDEQLIKVEIIGGKW